MITVYTDGSSRKSDEWIGVYSIFIYKDDELIYTYSDTIKPCTNNAAELTAVLKAIHYCVNTYPTESLQIYTDSRYVLNGDKRTRETMFDTNKKLWELYYSFKDKVNFTIDYVKAHNTSEGNNYVDELARTTLRKYFKNING